MKLALALSGRLVRIFVSATHTPDQPRYRPLGLTIAILATALGYGVLPLLPLMLVVWTAITRRQIGTELINTPLNWIMMGLGAITLIACIFAWIGRPQGARLALLGCVWLTTAVWAFRVLQSAFSAPELFGVGGSLTSAGVVCQVPLLILIPVYVTWYLNRAPARQFYRRRT